MDKNGRTPAPGSAGKKGSKGTPYYIVSHSGNKDFYPCIGQLLKAALAGVA
jgi:hypothetical protein